MSESDESPATTGPEASARASAAVTTAPARTSGEENAVTASAIVADVKGVYHCDAFHPYAGLSRPTVLILHLDDQSVDHEDKSNETGPEQTNNTAVVLEHSLAISPMTAPSNTTVPKIRTFHICLDTSASMRQSIKQASLTIAKLIDHLTNMEGATVSQIQQVVVYLFDTQCRVVRLGSAGVKGRDWIRKIRTGGESSLACVFQALIHETKKLQAEYPAQSMDATLFFFTDGLQSPTSSIDFGPISDFFQRTPGLTTTAHSFGFSTDHGSKLVDSLSKIGGHLGLYQVIENLHAVHPVMEMTVQALLDPINIGVIQARKVEVQVNENGPWISAKLRADNKSAQVIVYDQDVADSSNHDDGAEREVRVVPWRETLLQDDGVSGWIVHKATLRWLDQNNTARALASMDFIQSELSRLAKIISSATSSGTIESVLNAVYRAVQRFDSILGVIMSVSAKFKVRTEREERMTACYQTKAVLQSFHSLLAKVAKGTISNSELASFNSLAYGQITEARLKSRLDVRAGKNVTRMNGIETKIEEIVSTMDFEALAKKETKERLRELTCAMSTDNYLEALKDGQVLCLTMDVSRSQSTIMDSSQLVIKSIGPTFMTSSMYTNALMYSLQTLDGNNNEAENVHGGFNRYSDAVVVAGVAREKITAVLPLFLTPDHWQIARLRMRSILGYVVALDPMAFTYSQLTTVPFLVLMKSLESNPMTDFSLRQSQLILETCDAIYRESRDVQSKIKSMVQNYLSGHTHRTMDVIHNQFVFLGHVLCAVRAGDITRQEMDGFLAGSVFKDCVVEEQMRRDFSKRVSQSLMGNFLGWMNFDKVKDVVEPGRAYEAAYRRYAAEVSIGDIQEHNQYYRKVFRALQKHHDPESVTDDDDGHHNDEAVIGENEIEVMEQRINDMTIHEAKESSNIPTSMPASNAPTPILSPPAFRSYDFDASTLTLSKESLARLENIQHAVAPKIDSILRLFILIESPQEEGLARLAALSPPPAVTTISATAAVPTTLPGAVTPINDKLAFEYFATKPPKAQLATFLQSFAHTKNADRRAVQEFMAPFDELKAIEYLNRLFWAKINTIVNGIQTAVEQDVIQRQASIQSHNAELFARTKDLDAAAGILAEAKYRGQQGGNLVSAVTRLKMKKAKAKIGMMVTGMYKGVLLFGDKQRKKTGGKSSNLTGGDHSLTATTTISAREFVRWTPSRSNFYRLFQNNHKAMSFLEWNAIHGGRFEQYLAVRYHIDELLEHLAPQERVQCAKLFEMYISERDEKRKYSLESN